MRNHLFQPSHQNQVTTSSLRFLPSQPSLLFQPLYPKIYPDAIILFHLDNLSLLPVVVEEEEWRDNGAGPMFARGKGVGAGLREVVGRGKAVGRGGQGERDLKRRIKDSGR